MDDNLRPQLSFVEIIRKGCGVLAILIGAICILSGLLGVYDAMYSKGSGEWSGLGTLFVCIVDIPGAILTAILAFINQNRRIRMVAITLAVISFALPFVVTYCAYAKKQRYKHELDIGIQQDIEKMKRLKKLQRQQDVEGGKDKGSGQ